MVSVEEGVPGFNFCIPIKPLNVSKFGSYPILLYEIARLSYLTLEYWAGKTTTGKLGFGLYSVYEVIPVTPEKIAPVVKIFEL